MIRPTDAAAQSCCTEVAYSPAGSLWGQRAPTSKLCRYVTPKAGLPWKGQLAEGSHHDATLRFYKMRFTGRNRRMCGCLAKESMGRDVGRVFRCFKDRYKQEGAVLLGGDCKNDKK